MDKKIEEDLIKSINEATEEMEDLSEHVNALLNEKQQILKMREQYCMKLLRSRKILADVIWKYIPGGSHNRYQIVAGTTIHTQSYKDWLEKLKDPILKLFSPVKMYITPDVFFYHHYGTVYLLADNIKELSEFLAEQGIKVDLTEVRKSVNQATVDNEEYINAIAALEPLEIES